MMDRTSHRSSVTELPKSPVSPLGTSRLAGRQPLLQFDSNGDLRPSPEREQARISKSRSVFGVDQIWEREMAKVKIIQERQAQNEDVLNKATRKKEKGKGKAIFPTLVDSPQRIDLQNSVTASSLSGISPIKLTSDQPPKVQYSPIRGETPIMPFLTKDMPRQAAPSQLGLQSWFGSGDEESDREVARPRTLDKGKGRAEPSLRIEIDDDSEDDRPLLMLALVVEQKEISEEDMPLSTLAKVATTNLPSFRSSPDRLGQHSIESGAKPELAGARDHPDEQSQNDFEDDDIPLLMRKSISSFKITQDEDDLPLGHRYTTAAQQQTITMAQARYAEMYWANEMEAARRASMTSWNPYMVMGSPFPPAPYWGAPSHMGYAGYPSQPQMGYPTFPTQPTGLESHASSGGVTSGGPEKAIDNWRKDVCVAPNAREYCAR